MAVSRNRTIYQAHKLRQGIVHASADEMVVLYGDLAMDPGKTHQYVLEYPHHSGFKKPEVNVRFIKKSQLNEYILGRNQGKLAIPADLKKYAQVRIVGNIVKKTMELTNDRPGRWLHRWNDFFAETEVHRDGEPIYWEPGAALEVDHFIFTLKTEKEEGAYVFWVDLLSSHKGVQKFFHVIIYSKKQTEFPMAGVSDLSELYIPAANLSDKNGLISFMNPIYFAEQFLRVQLSSGVKRELVNCPDLPPDIPVEDGVLTKLQFGYELTGVRAYRFVKESSLDIDETPHCVDPRPLRQFDETIDLKKYFKRQRS